MTTRPIKPAASRAVRPAQKKTAPTTDARGNKTGFGNLANKLRPKTLEGLLGQPNVISIVRTWQKTGSWPRSILCSGATGGGKTTLAYILANLINGNTEVEEVNAGDETGVDRARSLIDLSKHVTLSGRPRVIIIDEAHALSAAAYKALLLPTERGSSSTIWIFTTNVPSAVKPELLRRCYHLTLKPVPEDTLAGYAVATADRFGGTLPKNLAITFAQQSNGSTSTLLSFVEKWLDLGCPESLSEDEIDAVLDASTEDSQTVLSFTALKGLLDGDTSAFMYGLLNQRSIPSFLFVARQVLKGFLEEKTLKKAGRSPHGLYYAYRKGAPERADPWVCVATLSRLLTLDGRTALTPEDVYCALLPLLEDRRRA